MNIYLQALKSFKDFVGVKTFYSILLLGTLTSTVLVSEPLFFGKILSFIEEYIRTGELDTTEFITYVGIWGAYIVFSIIIYFVYRYNYVDKNILRFYVANLEKSFEISLYREYGYLLEKKPGELFKKIEKGREGFINFYFFFFLDAFRNLSGLLFIIIFMLIIDIPMTLITLLGLPFVLYIGYFFNKRTNELQQNINDREDVLFGDMSDALGNFTLVKILSLEKMFYRNFSHGEQSLLEEQNVISYRWGIAHNYIGGLVAIMRLIVLLSGFYFITQGTLTFAELIIFFIFIGFIYFPISFVFGQLRQVQRWGAGLQSYYKEFEQNVVTEQLDKGKVLANSEGDIEFNNVTFGYTPESNILKNLNLRVPAGKKIALVGNTGAGKSTIVSLLLRFWDINSGSITIGNQDISDIKKSSLRKHIGVVSQDNSLFNLSIRENLLFAKQNATDKELKNALESAEAQFVFDLPDGIDTVIGERGLKLSGGEKQRISIARLFLKDPDIIVLDEATSALDNVTEKKIEKALKRLMKGKTSIIIAHRLSTIQHVDTIFILDKGKIVESGTYNELMMQKGKFYTLANPDNLILG